MKKWTIEHILKGALKYKASDIHLVHRVAPAYRVNGEIFPVEGAPLSQEDLWDLIHSIATEEQIEEFKEKKSFCITRHWPELGRCRVSAYFHAMCPELAIRVCETEIRSREELGLPPIIEELTRQTSGLILVVGPTGVGKTTTLNFMIDTINQERRTKIITIEDPVEFVHANVRSIVVQQEIPTDVPDFDTALINSLRQDPDVIVVGEMRSQETVETALIAADTGHLVIATLHTPDTIQAIQRIQSLFPAERHDAIRMQFANVMQAVIAQKLLSRADGKGRVLATEVCISTTAIKNKIRKAIFISFTAIFNLAENTTCNLSIPRSLNFISKELLPTILRFAM